MTREQEREALAKLIACLDTLTPHTESLAWRIADRILAAGWRKLPAVGAGDEALAKLIDPFSQGAASNEAGEAADRILAAGYRILPPDWPDDAAVERAADAWWEHFDGPFLSNKGAHPTYEAAVRKGMRAALLAAVSAQRDDDGS